MCVDTYVIKKEMWVRSTTLYKYISIVLKDHLLCPFFFLVALLPAKQALDSGGGEREERVDAAGYPGHGEG